MDFVSAFNKQTGPRGVSLENGWLTTETQGNMAVFHILNWHTNVIHRTRLRVLINLKDRTLECRHLG